MPDFTAIATEIGKLVTERNRTYGDSFARCGEILRVLYPGGISPHQYTDALAVVRILDKLFRIANGELEDSWRDVAGYAILGIANNGGTEIDLTRSSNPPPMHTPEVPEYDEIDEAHEVG